MSPLVLADHFIMTGPTFDLHPHAGMSAVTLLFESTRGRMSSHDSVHNNHLIEPGDLHWTLAGSGIVHTQRPHGENAWLDGLQLFVNLPARLKRTEPTTLLLRAADVPVIEYEGARLRVLAGDLAGVRSPLQPPEPILIVDGRLHAGAHATLPLPEGWNLWLYVRAGSMAAREVAATVDNGVALASGQAATVSAAANGNVELHGPDGEVAFVAIAGPAIHEPVIQLGPFVMNSRAEADQALADFQAGKFGTVPSFA
ncbi:MAG TPA: pirin-like C-terminal cupin domain-containing protein [Lysobacter sp.]|nr:pirin-like C-terminal cupin domain-containing protein [Lysobacter sp.]